MASGEPDVCARERAFMGGVTYISMHQFIASSYSSFSIAYRHSTSAVGLNGIRSLPPMSALRARAQWRICTGGSEAYIVVLFYGVYRVRTQRWQYV